MSDSQEPEGGGRSKRISSTKQKKLELLQKLRSGRNKYEVGELENVYDEVDEREYTKKVLERQDDDWIVDDGGCGYVEDGREIFDDDLDEESISKSKATKQGRKRPRDVGPSEKKGDVRKMIMSMPNKKKKEVVQKIEEDDVLGDIIGELGDRSGDASSNKMAPVKQKEVSAKEYLSSLASSKLKPKPIPRSLLPDMPKPMENEGRKSTPKPKVDEEPTVTYSSNGNSTLPIPGTVEKHSVEPVKIKQEPIDVEDFSEDIMDSLNQDFDDDDVIMAEPEESVAKKMKIAEVEILDSPEIETSNMKPVFEELGEEWIVQYGDKNSNAENVKIDRNRVPKDANGVLKFYYLDAHEEVSNQPGVVYLFGKIYHVQARDYVSCCVTVKNITRQIFLLPRPKRVILETGTVTNVDVTMSDVYEEFNSIVATKYRINEFRSRKLSKKYSFCKEDIPLESDYLEIRYPPTMKSLPSDLKGETFSRVFGCKTSFLEIFFLESGIKGPGWLDIEECLPNHAPCSWCKIEVTCPDPSFVSVTKYDGVVPHLVMMTIVPQAAYNNDKRQTEIVAISCLVHNQYPLDKPPPPRLFNQHFCLLSKPSDTTWPYDIRQVGSSFKKTSVIRVDSERALLNCFLTKLFVIDADVIVGHDLSGYGIDLLITRLASNKIPNWSRLGRLRRSNIPTSKFKSLLGKVAVTGRLLCDIKISAKELIRSRSYDLTALCQNVLHFPEDKRRETTDEDFKYAYCSGATLYDSVWNLMSDASYILRIFAELNVLPLALQITNIAGNLMSRTLMGGRSERNEFLLLHAFFAKGYILPDKEFKKKEQVNGENSEGKSKRKKPTYAGGLVLEPKVGFYDDFILLMDFNSLYPSIIQEYNICFSTIPLSRVEMDVNFIDEYAKFLPDESVGMGILPTEIRKLVESRRGVKNLLKNPNLPPELKMQYDIRQMALKLTANSMYGCLGFSFSRFYAKELAAMITAKGREILMNTKKMVENYGFEVVYGDTDSIMINTKMKDFDKVHSVGRRIKNEVNKFYKQVELDIDGVFKYMLLLRKKKYAAVTISKLPNGEMAEKQEIKGIDIVRRDWCQLAGEAGKFILKQILSDKSCDDKIDNIFGYLENIRQDLQDGKVPLSLLEVTKQLTKPPEDYTDPKSLPHVQVAIRMNATSKRFKQGDTVSYITCVDGTPNPATQRTYHHEELKSNPKLKVDIEYYLSQQIHPVIARLCDPIEGVDAASIARCLGLDPTKYKQSIRENNTDLDDNVARFGKDDEEKYKDCVRFSFKCENSSCGKENILEHPQRKNANGVKELVLEKCINPDCQLPPMEYLPAIQNQLHLKTREMIMDFLRGTLICEDPLCGFETNFINPVFEGPYPRCTKCNRAQMHLEVTPMNLYNQLEFFKKTFDLTRVTSKLTKFEPDVVQAFQKVHSQLEKMISLNKYSEINLGYLFNLLSVRKSSSANPSTSRHV